MPNYSLRTALLLICLCFSTFAHANLLSLRLQDRFGEFQRLEQWRGRVIVLNFWATWCAPCREELPMLNTMHQRFEPHGASIIGIALDQKIPVNNYANMFALAYPLLLAEQGSGVQLLRAYGSSNGALPYTVVLNRQGQIVARKTGIFQEEELASIIRTHLKP